METAMSKKDNKKIKPVLPVLNDRPGPDGTAGINSPSISLPAFNPPVPNRAWTAMRAGKDIEELTEEEKRDLYVGPDDLY